MSLGKVSIVIEAAMAQFESDLGRAQRLLEKQTKRMAADVTKFEGQARKAGKALGTAIAAGVAIATYAVTQAIDYADKLGETSEKLGISTEKLSAWGYAAKLSGTDVETLSGGLTKFNKFLAESSDPTSKQADLMAALGIATKDATGQLLKAEQLLPQLAARFASMDNAAVETKLAMELFGKSGAELLPLLNRGADGMQELEQRARQLGIVVSGETAQAAGAFNDKLDDMVEVARGLALEMAGKLLPSLDSFAATLQDPGIRDGLATIVIGLAKVTEFAIKSAAAVANFTKRVAEDLAASVHGIAADDLERQRQRIAGLQKMARDLETGGSMFGSKEGRQKRLAEVNAEIKQLQAAYAANSAMFGPKVNVISPTRRDFGKVRPPTRADALGGWNQDAIDRLLAGSDGRNGAGARAGLAKATQELTAAEKAYQEVMEDNALIDGLVDQYRRDQIDLEYQKARAIEEGQKRTGDMIADMEFELSTIGLSNLEREKAIALRYADAAATEAQRQRIGELVEEMQRAREAEAKFSALREATRGLFEGLLDYTTSARDAFKGFIDDIRMLVIRLLADAALKQLSEYLSNLGKQQGGGGGVTGGGWVGALLGAIGSAFGGGRASGGPTQRGMFYEVNERGPELYSSGGRTWLMAGARGGHVTPLSSQSQQAPPLKVIAVFGEDEAKRMVTETMKSPAGERVVVTHFQRNKKVM